MGIGDGVLAVTSSGALRWRRALAVAALLAFIPALQPAWAAPPVADPRGGANKPTVERAPNGVPVVQITAPSAGGVSHNKYTSYDVDRSGLILNNSSGIAGTQLGGLIAPNVSLGGTPAKVILNEVTGSASSLLAGYQEVAGAKAELVLANPNGITCNGCGFINVGRATLTTGTPVFGGTGSLDGYRVLGGALRLEGAGLDGKSVEQIDLLARTVTLNAGLWANRVEVVTGANDIARDDLSATRLVPSGEAPQVSLDIGALGGMYAGKIRLVGTEHGVGVTSAGTIAAAGGFTLRNDGRIVLGGSTTAGEKLTVSGGGALEVPGTVHAGGTLDVDVAGPLTGAGLLAAAGDAQVVAANVSSSGTLAAGVTVDGALTGQGSLTVESAGRLASSGKLLAGGALTAIGTSLDLGGATVQAGAGATLQTQGDLLAEGARIEAGGLVLATAGGTLDAAGASLRGQQLQLLGASVGLGAGASGPAANLQAVDALTVSGTNGVAAPGALLHAGGAVDVSSDAGRVELGGSDVAGQTVRLDGATLGLIGAQAGAQDALTLVARDASGRGIAADRATISAGGALDVESAERVEADSARLLGRTVSLQGTALSLRGASVRSTDWLQTVASAGDLDLTGGSLDANGSLLAQAGGMVRNVDGSILAQQVTVEASGLVSSGTKAVIAASGDLILRVDGEVANTDGSYLFAGNDLVLTNGRGGRSGAVLNEGGRIEAGHDLTLLAASLRNASSLGVTGLVLARNDAYLGVGLLDNQGEIQIGRSAAVDADTIRQGADFATLAAGARGAGPDHVDGATIDPAAPTSAAPDFQFTVPPGGLYHLNPDSGHPLVETDPRFTDLRTFLTSQYMLDRLPSSPEAALKRLGDGYYEEQLVLDQLAYLTGRRFLPGQTDAQAQLQAMMDAGVTFAKRLQLTVGVALTAEQVAQLTSPIVWPERQRVGGQDVLVTKVYIPGSQRVAMGGGSGWISAGKDLSLSTRGDYRLDKKLAAGGDVAIQAKNIQGDGGVHGYGKDLTLTADQGIALGATSLSTGGNLALTAKGGDVTSTATTCTSGDAKQRDTTVQGGKLTAGGSVSIAAKGSGEQGNVRLDAAAVTAGGSVTVTADQDVTLGAAEERHETWTTTPTGLEHTRTTATHGTSIAGADVFVHAGNDLSVRAGSVSGDAGVALVGGRDLSITSAQDTTYQHRREGADFQHTETVTQARTGLSTKNGPVILQAGRDGQVTGATLTAGGDAAITAARNLTLGAASDTTTTLAKQGDHASRAYDEKAQGTTISAGGNVELAALGTVQGGDAGTGRVKLQEANVQAGGSLGVYGGKTVAPSGTSEDNAKAEAEPQRGQGDVSVQGGRLTASKNVSIAAKGPDQAGSVHLDGAAVTAGGTATITADRDVTIGVPQEQRGTTASKTSLAGATVVVDAGNDLLAGRDVSITTPERQDDGNGLRAAMADAGQPPDGAIVLHAGRDARLGAEQVSAASLLQITAERDVTVGETPDSRGAASRGPSLSGLQVVVEAKNDLAMQPGTVTGVGGISLVAGRDLLLPAAQDPTTQAFQTSTLTAEHGAITLHAGRDARLTATKVTAGERVQLTAERDASLGAVEDQQETGWASGVDYTRTTTARGASLTGSQVLVKAGNDLSMQAGSVSGADGISLVAGRDLSITTAQDVATKNHQLNGDYERIETRTQARTVLDAKDGSILLQAGRDGHVTGASAEAGGNVVVLAARNLTLDAANDAQTVETKAGRHSSRTYDEQVEGTDIVAHGNAVIAAHRTLGVGADGKTTIVETTAADGGDAGAGRLVLSGSSVQAGGALQVLGKDVQITDAREEHDTFEADTRTKKGFLSKKTVTTRDEVKQDLSVGSLLSGNTVEVRSDGDLLVQGSQVVGDGDVELRAKGDLVIAAGEDRFTEHHERREKRSGLLGGTGGLGFTIGTQRTTVTTDVDGVSHQRGGEDGTVVTTASTVGSAKGNLTLEAGKLLDLRGSDLVAAGDITGSGQDVLGEVVYDTTRTTQTVHVKQSGFSVSLSSGALNPGVEAYQSMNRSAEVKDPRLQALYILRAARQTNQLTAQAADLVDSGTSPDVSLNIGATRSESRTQSTTVSSTALGSSVTAGGHVSITARGDGSADHGDLTLVGATVQGGTVTLDAARDLHLRSAENRLDTSSSSESWSMSAGFSATAGGGKGFGAGGSVSGSVSRSDDSGHDVTHTETQILSSGKITLHSGRDTTVQGAIVKGDAIAADVGRDLVIASEQDASTYHSKSLSASAQVTIGGGVSASATAGYAGMDSDYASVNEQSGFFAGKGGYDIKVKGNTHLQGAVIASEADPSKNLLDTGTLTYGDIENHSRFSATSASITVGLGGIAGSSLTPTVGAPVVGNETSTTRSAVSPGTIVVRNGPSDLSGLSRDTDHANHAIGNGFDREKVEERKELVEVFGQEAFKAVGDLAQHFTKEYDRAKLTEDAAKRYQALLDKGGDLTKEDRANLKSYEEQWHFSPTNVDTVIDRAQATQRELQGQYDTWKDGSAVKTALHAGVGALQAGLGGGSILAGGLGAGASEHFSADTAKLPGLLRPAASLTLGTMAGTLGGAGPLGSITGGATAEYGFQFNRDLHWTEIDRLKRLAASNYAKLGFADQKAAEDALMAVACSMVHCANEIDPSTILGFPALLQQGKGDGLRVDHPELEALLRQQQGAFQDKWGRTVNLFTYSASTEPGLSIYQANRGTREEWKVQLNQAQHYWHSQENTLQSEIFARAESSSSAMSSYMQTMRLFQQGEVNAFGPKYGEAYSNLTTSTELVNNTDHVNVFVDNMTTTGHKVTVDEVSAWALRDANARATYIGLAGGALGYYLAETGLGIEPAVPRDGSFELPTFRHQPSDAEAPGAITSKNGRIPRSTNLTPEQIGNMGENYQLEAPSVREPIVPLGRGSTANGVDRWLPGNVREELAVQEAMQNPSAGKIASGPLGDPRWPAFEGWVKMQQTVNPGGAEGPISVHYNYNTATGAVDDFKIVYRVPEIPIKEPVVPPWKP